MGYSFCKTDPSLTEGVQRIAHEQIMAALAEIDDRRLSHVKTAHQVRKRCKKLRSLIRLVKPGFKSSGLENAAFRDIGRSLASLREAGATLDMVNRLEQRFSDVIGAPFFEEVHAALGTSGRPMSAAKSRALLASARASLEEALERTAGWEVKGKAHKVLSTSMALTCTNADRAMALAGKSGLPDDYHEWRKRVKDHWYQMRLVKKSWPSLLHVRISDARKLATDLGDHHDFAVFRTDILPGLDCGDARICEALGGLIQAEEERLGPRCLKHGKRLFAEDPGAFGDRIGAYWKAWRD